MILDLPKTSERRKSPRYATDIPVDIVLNDGNILTVTTRNISNSGLQIACDSWVANEIEPRGIQCHNVSQLQFKMVADLTIGDSVQKLYANARIMSVQRMSQDHYILSIKFLDYENGSQDVLNKYIEQYTFRNIIHKGVVGE
jgi:hypothetical protein